MKEYIEREAAIALSKDIIVPQASGVGYKHRCIDPQDIRDIPAAEVVDGETYRELLKAARKMHCWIFLNTADELEVYNECGLTDEINALLGYGGQFTAKMDGGMNDDLS